MHWWQVTPAELSFPLSFPLLRVTGRSMLPGGATPASRKEGFPCDRGPPGEGAFGAFVLVSVVVPTGFEPVSPLERVVAWYLFRPTSATRFSKSYAQNAGSTDAAIC